MSRMELMKTSATMTLLLLFTCQGRGVFLDSHFVAVIFAARFDWQLDVRDAVRPAGARRIIRAT